MSAETIVLKNPEYTDKTIVHEISTIEEFEEMKKVPGVKVVLFSAPWLQPGKRQAEKLENIFEDSDRFSMFFVDIEKGKDICIRENYISFPLTLIMKNDLVLNVISGVSKTPELEDKINIALG